MAFLLKRFLISTLTFLVDSTQKQNRTKTYQDLNLAHMILIQQDLVPSDKNLSTLFCSIAFYDYNQ